MEQAWSSTSCGTSDSSIGTSTRWSPSSAFPVSSFTGSLRCSRLSRRSLGLSGRIVSTADVVRVNAIVRLGKRFADCLEAVFHQVGRLLSFPSPMLASSTVLRLISSPCHTRTHSVSASNSHSLAGESSGTGYWPIVDSARDAGI